MRYGVIVCPACGKAKGVEADKKTTKCQCGREVDLVKTKLEFRTESPMELADAVAQANALLAGGEKLTFEKKPRKKGPYAAVSEKAKAVKDPLERLRIIAQELTMLKGDFDADDVRKVTNLIGRESAEDVIARLKEHGLVYETADGKYRLV